MPTAPAARPPAPPSRRRTYRYGWRAGFGWLAPGTPQSITVDAQGLTEQPWRGEARHHPWATLHDVLEDALGVTLFTADGEVHLPPGLDDQEQLLWQVRRALGLPQPDRTPGRAIPPAQVAAWLRLALGERLFVGGPAQPWRARAAALAGIAAAAALLGLLFHLGPLLGVAFLCLPLALLAVAVGSRDIAFEASPEGLRVRRFGRWRSFGWSAVESIRRMAEEGAVVWLVGIAGRTYPLPPGLPGADRLAIAFRHAVAAREAGQLLPDYTDIPETALSRSRPDEAVAERSLSRFQEAPADAVQDAAVEVRLDAG